MLYNKGMNFIDSIKAAIIGILVSVISSGVSSPSVLSQATSTPEIYEINGTYSYLGQSINYSIKVPRKGGQMTGTISGACQADIKGDYEGEAEGKFSGNASGKCSFLFVKYDGSVDFKGNLYPQRQELVVETENPHVGPITLKY